MTFDEAKEFLSDKKRWELRDHAFGDCEFGWNDELGNETAGGYSGGGRCDVWVGESQFHGDQARELKSCGALARTDRNDETGPDEYVQDEVMPGLSTGDVYHELTGKYLDGS